MVIFKCPYFMPLKLNKDRKSITHGKKQCHQMGLNLCILGDWQFQTSSKRYCEVNQLYRIVLHLWYVTVIMCSVIAI